MTNLINIRDFAALQQRDSEEYTRELVALNDYSAEYGLQLTEAQAKELIETRGKALRDNDRIERGIGSVRGLIESFASSSYLTQENYADTLNDLIEIFYYMKTETHDSVSDRDLLETMKDQFENRYHGSVELMQGREFRYDKDYDEMPFEYKMGDGDDDGSNPTDSDDYEYLWESKRGKGGRREDYGQ